MEITKSFVVSFEIILNVEREKERKIKKERKRIHKCSITKF